MYLRKYSRRIRAGIIVSAERVEHHEFKHPRDRNWVKGWAESSRDYRTAEEVIASGSKPEFLVRGITRFESELRIWLGWFTLELSFITPWRVDPNWERAQNEISEITPDQLALLTKHGLKP